MNIQNFETAYLNAGGKATELEKEDGEYVSSKAQMGWQMWQAAKTQAVPEGFVLVPKDLIQSIHQSCVNTLIAESMPAFKAVSNTIIDELSPIVRAIQAEAQEQSHE
jgi:hypothetical protein